jgi:hypothetical protein
MPNKPLNLLQTTTIPLVERDPLLVLRDYLEETTRQPVALTGPPYQERVWDRILLTTMPRSATHYYLIFLRELFGFKRRFADCELDPNPAPAPPRWDPYESDTTYRTLGAGEILGVHYVMTAELAEFLRDHDHTLAIHTIRDIRDAVVSSTRYIYSSPNHPISPLFGSLAFGDALLLNIIGCCIPFEYQTAGSQQKNPQRLPIIYDGHRSLAERSRPWRCQPGVVVLRYEDFFDRDLAKSARYIVSQFRDGNITVDEDRVLELRRNLTLEGLRQEQQSDKHFYRGEVGGWRDAFGPIHKMAAKVAFGKWLIDFGYESSLDW